MESGKRNSDASLSYEWERNRARVCKYQEMFGYRGEVGAYGDVGPEGKDGRPGVQGELGVKGTKGSQGRFGLDGADGPPGEEVIMKRLIRSLCELPMVKIGFIFLA